MPLLKPSTWTTAAAASTTRTLTTPSKSPWIKKYLDYRIFLKSIRSMTEPLPDLPAVERLSPRVLRILGGNPSKFTLQGTNTYLVGSGRERILIDTGEGKDVWRETLGRVLGEEEAEVGIVLLTHWHHDHVGGVRDALALSPRAKVFKSQISPSEYAERRQEDICHGQVFEVEGARLRAFHSPGHTVDHMALVLEEENAMFTGDNVLGHGTAVFEDLAAYMASLEGMRSQFTGRAYPAHGAPIADGPAKIREYISHRQEREDQVLAVLKSDRPEAEEGDAEGWRSMAMVRIIYKEYPENLHGPAEGSLLQVLRKMEMDGRVRRCGDGSWKLTEKAAL